MCGEQNSNFMNYLTELAMIIITANNYNCVCLKFLLKPVT